MKNNLQPAKSNDDPFFYENVSNVSAYSPDP